MIRPTTSLICQALVIGPSWFLQEPVGPQGASNRSARSSDGPLLPPRPNPGPQSWPESTTPFSDPGKVVALVVLLIFVLILIVGFAWRTWFRKGRNSVRSSLDLHKALDALDDLTRAIRAAEILRAALVNRLGPAWAAKTTEEIALEVELRDLLDPSDVTRLLDILSRADLAKFAGATSADPALIQDLLRIETRLRAPETPSHTFS